MVTNNVDEWTYFEQYFGQRPDEYQRARFLLMRQVMHMFCAAVFLLLGAAGKPISQSEKLPSFGDFHRQIWAGEVNLADNDLKIVCGMVHWEQLLQNTRRIRFDEALGVVSARNTGQEGVRLLLPRATRKQAGCWNGWQRRHGWPAPTGRRAVNPDAASSWSPDKSGSGASSPAERVVFLRCRRSRRGLQPPVPSLDGSPLGLGTAAPSAS